MYITFAPVTQANKAELTLKRYNYKSKAGYQWSQDITCQCVFQKYGKEWFRDYLPFSKVNVIIHSFSLKSMIFESMSIIYKMYTRGLPGSVLKSVSFLGVLSVIVSR